MPAIKDALKTWFQQNARTFPWRETRDPYQIWISEVMLQQTQASVVVDYFERWIATFPDIHTLAHAPIEKVLKQWEGLGYYSRARSLHKAARILDSEGYVNLPKDVEKLKTLPGIGPYTLGAIMSFAFHQAYPAVDANVIRVISRILGIETPVKEVSSERAIYKGTEELLKDNTPWVIMEALIELGALICKKKPLCIQCPLKQHCRAFLEEKQDLIPLLPARKKTVYLKRDVFIFVVESELFIRKAPENKVLGGLYEFPWVETGAENLNFSKESTIFLKEVAHSFTHHQVTLYPRLFFCEKRPSLFPGEWLPFKEVLKKTFNAGHKKIVNQLHPYIDIH